MRPLNLDAIRRLITRYRLSENSLTAVILDRLLAEVERLQAALNQREEMVEDLAERLFLSGQEVKRLRARVAEGVQQAIRDAQQVEELPPAVPTKEGKTVKGGLA